MKPCHHRMVSRDNIHMTGTIDRNRAPDLDAVLVAWRREGRALVEAHATDFQCLMRRLESLIAEGRYTQAVATAQIAANYATFWHGGLFASASLERALKTIGECATPSEGYAPRPVDPSRPMKVLHVATQVAVVSGHARMIRRWIKHDQSNVHSLILTRQIDRVPPELQRAVESAGGCLEQLNRKAGSVLAWARRLQRAISRSDMVVLHVHNMDVIPFIALGGMKRRPPVIFLNHSDHLFWLGAGFADMVVNTRVSGHRLSVARRGIEERRNALLPLCLEPMARSSSREAAKAALGFPADSVIILTIARSVKYRSSQGRVSRKSFARPARRPARPARGRGTRPEGRLAGIQSGRGGSDYYLRRDARHPEVSRGRRHLPDRFRSPRSPPSSRPASTACPW